MEEKLVEKLFNSFVEDKLQKLIINITEENNKESNKKLDSIQRVVDLVRTENEEQGKDLSTNTKAIKNLQVEFETFRNDVNARDKKLHTKVTETVTDSITETMPGAVELAVTPQKKKLLQIPHRKWFRWFKKGGKNG